jgi:hypothetical protein
VYTDDGELELRVGAVSERLDELLVAQRVSGGAFLTAWNPRSERLDGAANAMRQERLLAYVRQTGFAWLAGEGRDPAAEWPAEESLLILGIDGDAAAALALRYGQNAFVQVAVGEPVQLVLTGYSIDD